MGTAITVKGHEVSPLIAFILPVPARVVAAAYASVNLSGAVGDLLGC